jgi:hypothetical protein
MKLGFDPWAVFLGEAVSPPGGGGLTALGVSRSKFCFAGFSSMSSFALIRRASG